MDLYTIRNILNTGKSIYDIPLRAVYYARVSTDKDEQLHSIKNQIEYYANFIKTNPNWTYIDGYVDEGISGTSVNKRESFLKMINDAKENKFDFIITKEISRFSRNTMDSIQYTQQLLSYGVGVLFQSDNINTLFPDAELRLTIMSSIAQDEVRKISERVKFGFKRAIENGVVLGNNRIWGYTKDNGKLVIIEEEAEMVRKIYDMYANQNIGIRRICKWLGEQGIKNSKENDFSFTTIRNILINPKYKGYYCGNKSHKYDYKLNDRKYLDQSEWTMYKDEDGEIVPAIVSEEIWDKANYILRTRSEKQSSDNPTSYQNKYTYSGKIICMEHNVPYYRACYKYKSGEKEVWQCKKYSEQGKIGCDSPTIYTSELNDIMKEAYNFLIENKSELINEIINTYSNCNIKSKPTINITKVQTEINDIFMMKNKLLDLSIKGKLSDDEFEIRNNKFNDEIQVLKEKILNLQNQEQKNKEISLSLETLQKYISTNTSFENALNYEVIDALLDHIEVNKTNSKSVINLKIYFKIIREEIIFIINRQKNKESVYYIKLE